MAQSDNNGGAMGFETEPFKAADKRRRSMRLRSHDYSLSGAYFVTACVQDRACVLGDVVGEAMQLNDAGRMVQRMWDALPRRFPNVELDVFVVMPNHVHGILWIIKADLGATLVVAPSVVTDDANRAGTRPALTRGAIAPFIRPAPSVGDIVGAFKSLTTVAYARGVKQSHWPAFRTRLWQRNYYEHIIRDDESLNRMRQYIADNPAQWAGDRENPSNM